ncbi:Uncharacterised protein [Mycobacteroides abscessus subsp. abscessus]|nr:Uncharacterised protein [Mycobacteroides abscessus subsp. abscessus]
MDTATDSALPSSEASVPNADCRLVRQMLRPSTTPATRVLPASSGTDATAEADP